MGRLKGKVAFITGASSGIGAATAKRMAEEGAIVTIAARRAKELSAVADAIRANGGEAHPLVLDVGDLDTYARALNDTAKRFGRLDVLVNDAMAEIMGMITDFSLENWRRDFLINSDAIFVSTQTAFKIMIPQGGGSIINVSSICGTRATAGTAGYAASKAALNHFSAIAAIEGAPHNVRVNVVVPGLISTPAATASFQGDEKLVKATERAIPMQRAGRDEELANAVLFLASDESSYITGCILPVDGGKAIQLYVPSGDSSYFEGGQA